MANTFKDGKDTITYKVESIVHNKVTYSNGVVLEFDGSSAVQAVKDAYIKNKPIVTPPIIIVPPSPGQPKEISWKDFTQLKDVENQSFALKPGVYSDAAYPRNLKKVTVEGNNKVQLTTNYRGVILSGMLSEVTLSGLNLKDIPDYQISIDGADKINYTGRDGSFVDGLTLQNIVSKNGGTLFQSEGNITAGVISGLIKRFVMKNCEITGGDPGSVCWLGNTVDSEIFGNKVNGVNMTSFTKGLPNGIHNGLFTFKGSLKFHDNIVMNHQGQVVRAWLHSIDGLKTVEVYNNFVYNAWKYGLLELHLDDGYIKEGAKFANAKVYNNVAGKLGVSKDWDAQMVDLYNFGGGTLEYYGNQGWDMSGTKPVSNMINNMSDTMIIVDKGNVYFPSLAKAMEGISTLKSLLA
jgi:Leucine-rich repeat (LRR) protein